MSDPRRTILVVDDDDDVRETVVDALSLEGYHVIAAPNGLRALEMLRATDSPPALILLDLMMPVMDGEEFRRLQLKDTELARIPVVIVSAHASSEMISTELQADGYLRKPVELLRLYDIAHKLT